MALDLVILQLNTIPENEGKYWHDQAIEEKVREKANTHGADNKECTRSPSKTNWLGTDHRRSVES